MRNKKTAVLAILICLVILSAILSLSYGTSLTAVWRGFFESDGFGLILKKIRLPRTIIASWLGARSGCAGLFFSRSSRTRWLTLTRSAYQGEHHWE